MKRIGLATLVCLCGFCVFSCGDDSKTKEGGNSTVTVVLPGGTPIIGNECEPRCFDSSTALCATGLSMDGFTNCPKEGGCAVIGGRARCYEKCLVKGEVDTREIEFNDKWYKQTRTCLEDGGLLFYSEYEAELCNASICAPGHTNGDSGTGNGNGNGDGGGATPSQGSGTILCSGMNCAVSCSNGCNVCTSEENCTSLAGVCKGMNCKISCDDANCKSAKCEGECMTQAEIEEAMQSILDIFGGGGGGGDCTSAGCELCSGSSCVVVCDDFMGCSTCSGITCMMGEKTACVGEDCTIKCENAGCSSIICEGEDCP